MSVSVIITIGNESINHKFCSQYLEDKKQRKDDNTVCKDTCDPYHHDMKLIELSKKYYVLPKLCSRPLNNMVCTFPNCKFIHIMKEQNTKTINLNLEILDKGNSIEDGFINRNGIIKKIVQVPFCEEYILGRMNGIRNEDIKCYSSCPPSLHRGALFKYTKNGLFSDLCKKSLNKQYCNNRNCNFIHAVFESENRLQNKYSSYSACIKHIHHLNNKNKPDCNGCSSTHNENNITPRSFVGMIEKYLLKFNSNTFNNLYNILYRNITSEWDVIKRAHIYDFNERLKIIK